MKKIGEILLIIITVLGLPGIIELVSKNYYDIHKTPIWVGTLILGLFVSLTQLNLRGSSVLGKLFRTLRFYLFKTKTIAIVLMVQLLTVLTLLLLNYPNVDIKIVFLSFGANLVGLNLLVVLGKISNADTSELVLHDTGSGKMYLYSKDQLKHVPDPATFDALGLNWSEVLDVTDKELSSYKIASPITSIKNMRLLNYRGRVYGLVNDKLKHIPDMQTLGFIRDQRTDQDQDIEVLTDINGYEKDKPFARV